MHGLCSGKCNEITKCLEHFRVKDKLLTFRRFTIIKFFTNRYFIEITAEYHNIIYILNLILYVHTGIVDSNIMGPK